MKHDLKCTFSHKYLNILSGCILVFFVSSFLYAKESMPLMIPPYTHSYNYTPKEEKEISYYVQAMEFLRKNPGAIEILEATRDDHSTSILNKKIIEITQKRLSLYPKDAVISTVDQMKEILTVLKDNTDLSIELGIELNRGALKSGLTLEVDVGGVIADVAEKFTGPNVDSLYERREAVARFMTQEHFLCQKTEGAACFSTHHPRYVGLYHILGQIYSYKDLPQDVDISQLKQIDANLGEIAEYIHFSHKLNSIEKGSKEYQDTLAKVIQTLDKNHEEIEENLRKQVESGEYRRRRELIENDPDYAGMDAFIITQRSQVRNFEQVKKDQKNLLDQGVITQTQYESEIKKLDDGIEIKRKNIEAYEFQKDMNHALAGVQILLSVGRMVKAPPEILQAGQALYVGGELFAKLSIMAITGVVNPTSLLSAVSSLESLVSIVGGQKTSNQLILEALNNIQRRQIKILNKLYEVEFKIEGLKHDLDEIKRVLEYSFKEIQDSFNDVKIELKQIESNISTRIHQLEDTVQSGMQSILAEDFTTDTIISAQQDKEWHHYSIEEILGICRYYKEKSQNSTQYAVDIEDRKYHSCINNVNARMSTITEQLSESYYTLEANVSGKKFVFYEEITEINNNGVQNHLAKNSNERIGFLPSILRWIEELLSEAGEFVFHNFKIEDLEQNSPMDTAENLDQSLESSFVTAERDGVDSLELQILPAGSDCSIHSSDPSKCLRHPLYFDQSFLAYVELTERLPHPDFLDVLPQELQMDYSRITHLENMCRVAQSMSDISKSLRDHVDKPLKVVQLQIHQIRKLLYDNMLQKLSKQYEGQSRTNLIKEAVAKYKLRRTVEKIKQEKEQYNITEQDIRQLNLMIEGIDQNSIVQEFQKTKSDQDLIDAGFSKKVNGDCIIEKSLEDGKPEVFTKADLSKKSQKEHFNNTLGNINNQGGCWIHDIDHVMDSDTPAQFQLEAMVSYKNDLDIEDEKMAPLCLLEERIIDGAGVGTAIGAVVGGATGVVVDVLALGTTVGGGTMVGAGFGGAIGAMLDGIEGVYSICLESNLNKSLMLLKKLPDGSKQWVNTNPRSSNLIRSQSESIRGDERIEEAVRQKGINHVFYENTPLSEYLDLDIYPISQLSTSERDSLGDYDLSQVSHFSYFYSFDCKKRACLAYKKIKKVDRKSWNQKTEEEIQALNTGFKIGLQSELRNDLAEDLYKSVLALDTVAKAGYGENLLHQKSLRNNLEKLKSFIGQLSKIFLEDPRKITINNITQIIEDMNLALEDIVIEDTIEDDYSGMGDPKARQKAFHIINNRDYLNPKQCLIKER